MSNIIESMILLGEDQDRFIRINKKETKVEGYDEKTGMAAEALTSRQLGRGLKNSDFVVKLTLAYAAVAFFAITGAGLGLGALILGMFGAAPFAFAVNQYKEKLNKEWRQVFDKNVKDIEARS